MSQVITIPPGTPRAEQERTFSKLWRHASNLATNPGDVTNAGGYRIRVTDEIADALRGEDVPAPGTETTAPAAEGGTDAGKTEPVTPTSPVPAKRTTKKATPAKKAPAKKAAKKRAPAKKAAAKKSGAAKRATTKE